MNKTTVVVISLFLFSAVQPIALAQEDGARETASALSLGKGLGLKYRPEEIAGDETLFVSATEPVDRPEMLAQSAGNLPNLGGRDTPSEEDPWAVNFWLKSRHFNDREHKILNENNLGLGLRYYHKKSFAGERWFSEVNMVKNSFRRLAVTVGMGFEYKFVKGDSWAFSAGLEGGYAHYEARKKTLNGLIAVPFGSFHYRDITFTLVFIPRREFDKLEVVIGYVSIPTKLLQ